jgi:hypothetical protein
MIVAIERYGGFVSVNNRPRFAPINLLTDAMRHCNDSAVGERRPDNLPHLLICLQVETTDDSCQHMCHRITKHWILTYCWLRQVSRSSSDEVKPEPGKAIAAVPWRTSPLHPRARRVSVGARLRRRPWQRLSEQSKFHSRFGGPQDLGSRVRTHATRTDLEIPDYDA